jgi:predicted AAA+ superfamily ATPase
MDRAIVQQLLDRLTQEPRLLQIVIGPRQAGKTTAVRTVGSHWAGPVVYAAADLPLPPGPEWIETHWLAARREASRGEPLLILDEVQKVARWSEVVKALWDEDRAQHRAIHVVLLGSSSLLLSKGAAESLAGRFFLNRCLHWSFDECRRAFGWDLDHWIFFGGYPGAAALVHDEVAWRAYITDSLIETVIARDVLAMQTVAKPALLRHLFGLSARFPAQILSYNKMLGQLRDAGNTTTLAHYLRLLETAFLLSGLERFSSGGARSRGSSPKLVFWNNALVSALEQRSLAQVRSEPDLWGRLVENAVGSHLLNHLQGLPYEVTYWRERGSEVDYIVRAGRSLWAIEVKSGRPSGAASGLAAFRNVHRQARALIVGSGGVSLEEFLAVDPREFLI